MNVSDIWLFVLLALAVAAASVTTTRSTLAKIVRANISARHEILTSLLDCPYCVAHWFAILPAFYMTSDLFEFLILWPALIGASALLVGALQRVLLITENEIAYLTEKVVELTEEKDQLLHELAEHQEQWRP